jgi:hypothetical protein
MFGWVVRAYRSSETTQVWMCLGTAVKSQSPGDAQVENSLRAQVKCGEEIRG